MGYKAAVQVSGGAASYVEAKLTLEEFGHDEVAFVFADTLIEDEDLYRFLGDMEKRLNHPVIRIADGRTPWQVFHQVGLIGNTQKDPCSRLLKRELLERWRKANAPDAQLMIGFDAMEDHRLVPMQTRMAPVVVRSHLSEQGIWKEDAKAIVRADGLRLPRLYDMGFAHNNCGGFCVKAGQASFALLLDHFPERYAAHEAEEEAFRARTGKDVSILRDRRGGDTKTLTLRQLRERRQQTPQLIDWLDVGGCGCTHAPDEEIEPA